DLVPDGVFGPFGGIKRRLLVEREVRFALPHWNGQLRLAVNQLYADLHRRGQPRVDRKSTGKNIQPSVGPDFAQFGKLSWVLLPADVDAGAFDIARLRPDTDAHLPGSKDVQIGWIRRI